MMCLVSLSANEETERDTFCSVGGTLEPWGRSAMREEPRLPLKSEGLCADSLYSAQQIRSLLTATLEPINVE